MVRLIWLGFLVLPFSSPSLAAAQDCPTPEPDLYPAEGSGGVPRAGVVRVVFHEPYDAQPAPQDVLRLFEDQSGMEVAGTVRVEPDAQGTRVELLADAPLAANTAYRASVLGPFGGTERSFVFRTGELIADVTPPVFDGASSIRVLAADDLSCADDDPPLGAAGSGDRGYRVTVDFPPAQDESGPANLDYVLYQTLGPETELPIERKRVRTFGVDELFGAVFLPGSAVHDETICFVVHAVDMFGNVAIADREACGDPAGPGKFSSMCSAAGPQERTTAAAVLPVAILAWAATLVIGRRHTS